MNAKREPFGRLAVAAVSVAISSSCITAAQIAELNAKNTQELLRRAAFDLSCPEASIQTQCLKESAHGVCQTSGVTGCDKRATYVRLEKSYNNWDWVMNNAEK